MRLGRACGLPLKYNDILKDLKELGIGNGDILAVHSSLKKVGQIEGGPETLIEAMKSTVGRRGTILMPTFTKPSDVFIVTDAPPYTGLLSETFLRKGNAVRSLHPTHSVAVWGRYARNLVRDHHKHQPLGRNSPFHRLVRRKGKVVLVGVDFTKASIVHVAESIAGSPYQDIGYPGYGRRTVVVAANGKRVKYAAKENPGCSAGFIAVQNRLRQRNLLTEARIGNAKTIVSKAEDILDAALELLTKDGTALLCKNAKCPVCPPRRKKVAGLNWRYSY